MKLAKFTLAEIIIKERTKQGLSQSELARRANVDRNSLIRIENGTIKNPTCDTIYKVARVLNLDIKLLDLFKEE